MALGKGTIKPLVAEWGTLSPPAWTVAEADAIATALQAISDHVTPHVVADVALSRARLQRHLLDRTVRHVERWLIGAAAITRRAYRMDEVRLTADGSGPALGLRAATDAQLRALPGVDAALATRIGRFTAQSPQFTDVGSLAAVDGISDAGAQRLAGVAYRDHPLLALLSPALVAFLRTPGVPQLLDVFQHTDLELSFGDGSTLLNAAPATGSTRARRLLALLATIREQAARSSSVASATLGSEALRRLDRVQTRRRALQRLRPADGALLVDDAYLDAAAEIIGQATTRIELMVFLATASAGTATAPGPLALIEALEAAAARGVAVRVILDQDEDGVPYRSAFINRPVAQRLAAAGVKVRLDAKDVLLHSKVLVVDTATTVVGSHNWTGASMGRTHEVSVRLDAPAIARDFRARFDALWAPLTDL